MNCYICLMCISYCLSLYVSVCLLFVSMGTLPEIKTDDVDDDMLMVLAVR